MNIDLVAELPRDAVLKPAALPRLQPALFFFSIVALAASSLEIELLEHLDALSKYMTYSEIALDAGVALLVVFGLAVIWWIGVLLAVATAGWIPSTRHHRVSLTWHLGLGFPLAYLVINFCGAILRMSQLHLRFSVWVVLAAGFLITVTAGLFVVSTHRLQQFCSARLVPIGWLHVVLGMVAIMALWANGVHLFHDYVHAGRPVASSKLPDIYLVTFDALRANDTSVYGYDRPTTPNLARFAQRSVVFDYLFASSNFTTPTTTSIETGQLPWSHRVFQGGGSLHKRDQADNLGAMLRQRGYYTAMITSNFLAGPFRHRTLAGYDAVEFVAPEGLSGKWSQYTNFIGANTQFTLTVPLLQIVSGIRQYADALLCASCYPAPPEAVFDRARSLLERSDIHQPRFVWMHVLAPHDPYLPPPPYQKTFLPANKLTRATEYLGMRPDAPPPGVTPAELQARYDEMILYADHAFGNFLNWLDQTNRLSDAVVIVSADHGESFEHNWYFHTGPYLYDGLIHIPLLIHLPGQSQAARTDVAAEQADLMPTILDLVGDSTPAWVDGTSLVPVLKGGALSPRYIFSMNLEDNRAFDPITRGTVAVMDDQFKFVDYLEPHREALYRYRTDRTDEHDLIASEPEVANRMRGVLLAKLKEVNQRFPPKP